MLYDDLMTKLRPKIDVCWTSIRTLSDRRFSFDKRRAARKFSDVIRLPQFAKVRERAGFVYDKMATYQAYVPWVDVIDGGIKLTYVSDWKGVEVVFNIYPDQTKYKIHSLLGEGAEQLCDEGNSELFSNFAAHVNGDIVIVDMEGTCV